MLRTPEAGDDILSGQPAPLPDCPRGKDDLAYIQSGPLLFQMMLLVSCPPSMYHYEETGSVFLTSGSPPSGTGRPLLGTLQSHLLCRLNMPDSLSLSSLGKCFSPQPSRSLLNSLQFLNVFPVLGSPKGITIRRRDDETLLYQFFVYVELCFFLLNLY